MSVECASWGPGCALWAPSPLAGWSLARLLLARVHRCPRPGAGGPLLPGALPEGAEHLAWGRTGGLGPLSRDRGPPSAKAGRVVFCRYFRSNGEKECVAFTGI